MNKISAFLHKAAYYLAMLGTFIISLAFFLSFIYLFDFEKKQGEHLGLSPKRFLGQFKNILDQFMDFKPINFFDYALNPKILDGFFHSYTILGISLAIIICMGGLIAFLGMISPLNKRRKLHGFLDFFEGLPDLMFIFAVNMLNITFLKQYNYKIFSLYGFGSNQPIVFPVIVISFLPVILFGLYLLKSMEDEEHEQYILVGFSKGLAKSYLYFIHMIRNILPVFMIKFRLILYMLLSNLVLVEHMYFYETAITNEIMIQMFRGDHALTMIYSIIMFILPVILLEFILKFVITITVLRKLGEIRI